MEPNSSTPEAQQLSLFEAGTTLTELAVDTLQGDPEQIRGAAGDLLILVQYHARKADGEVIP